MTTSWPPLPLESWRDTYAWLHRAAQIVGKMQLALTPLVNHYWNAAFRPTPRGLTTPALPYHDRFFSMELDFIDHELVLRTGEGQVRALPFLRRPIATFYEEVKELLAQLGLSVAINDHPVEIVSETIPFHRDRMHAVYEPEPVERLHRIILASAAIFEEFRARFIGKCSPVHFWWGSFDLAVSRFSGRRAWLLPSGGRMMHEAYSHEVSSVGFWPGDVRFPRPVYYAYLAPKPAAYEDALVRPGAAFWHPELGEWLLPYDAVRESVSPRDTLLEFLQSTYEAGAELAGWDRNELERREAEPAAQGALYTPAHPPQP